MLPIIQIGPLSIQSDGLVILAGLWFALGRIEKHSTRFSIGAGLLETLVIISLGVGIIGARIGYVAQNPDLLSSGWLAILTPRPEMLDLAIGVLTGILAGILYGRNRRLLNWNTLDALSPGVALFMSFIALSHLLSGNGYGMPTSLPWGITLAGTSRHPSQIYELTAALVIFFWVERQLRGNSDGAQLPGRLILRYGAASFGARIFLETFRGDSTILSGNIRLEQLVAFILFAICLWLIDRRERQTDISARGAETATEVEAEIAPE